MPTCLIQGHRGFSERYPENTMLGFRMALDAGAGALETDLRRTCDGGFVLCHDPALDRTTAGRGAIADLTWPEIAGLDASYAARFGSAFAGRADCTVPRLTDFLDELRGHPVYLVLHLKALAGPDLDTLLETITRRHMTPQCHFFGPPAAIDRIKLLEPGCLTLNDGMPGPAQYRAVLGHALARGHDAVSINPNCSPDELRAMVDAIHAAGKLAHASYLADDYARRTQELIDAGVDYILGNDPAAMVEVFRANGLRQVAPGQ